jgi:uncharacterized membrane-anchored protein
MAHPSRHVAAGEIHARPFHPAHSPMRFLHFAFVTNPEDAELDRDQLRRFCAEHGVDGPALGVKHHRVELKSGAAVGTTLRVHYLHLGAGR